MTPPRMIRPRAPPPSTTAPETFQVPGGITANFPSAAARSKQAWMAARSSATPSPRPPKSLGMACSRSRRYLARSVLLTAALSTIRSSMRAAMRLVAPLQRGRGDRPGEGGDVPLGRDGPQPEPAGLSGGEPGAVPEEGGRLGRELGGGGQVGGRGLEHLQ